MGHKVRFLGATDDQARWGGGSTDPYESLVEGQVYEVEDVEVHSWHTKIMLVGIDGVFNSVCFTGVVDE